MYPTVTVQTKKAASAAHRHPWIFSGALTKRPDGVDHGALVRAVDEQDSLIGVGTYSAKSSIAVRLFAFAEEPVIDRAWFVNAFRAAQERRDTLGIGPDAGTTGYRLVFGESDGVPGLIVDRYGDVLVVQSSTAGMDALLDAAVSALEVVFAPSAIVERSDIPVRKEEALKERVRTVIGEAPETVPFAERGMKFSADVLGGQKTGFYLDQRDLRAAIERFSAGRKVLNLFSYTGAHGVAAMKGGAISALNVDASGPALALCAEHAAMNGIDPGSFTTEESDIFQYVGAQSEPRFGMVIMDPPALIKSQGDAEEGKKAYHFLNRAAMRLVEDGGIFVTSSCSRYMSEEDLAFTLRRASMQAGAVLETLAVVRQAGDHPTSVYFPESAYLTSFVCKVRR
jgi:23S rRNA (cytosine1962-C5)-methyltransferase